MSDRARLIETYLQGPAILREAVAGLGSEAPGFPIRANRRPSRRSREAVSFLN